MADEKTLAHPDAGWMGGSPPARPAPAPTYRVKEIFHTLQGEGHHCGRAAVFIRFAGCNLWSGLESDRVAAQCAFCDTDFLGTGGELGGEYDADGLADTATSLWPGDGPPFVVCTGGEPLLQLDEPLLRALHLRGCFIAVETNGTVDAVPGIDWLTVSPKAGSGLQQRSGDELKLVYPQPAAHGDGGGAHEGERNKGGGGACIDPSVFEQYAFEHFYLQPMDGPGYQRALSESVAFCKGHPKWRLSLQVHKIIGVK